MARDEFIKAYTQQKSNAKQRGIDFEISLEDWKGIWVASGKWDDRGRGANKYCMSRFGDKGEYVAGNVFIQLGKHNVSEGNLGKLDSDETRKLKSKAMIGTLHPWAAGKNNPMHRPEVKAKMSLATGGGNHYNARSIVTPYGVFATAGLAAEALGMNKVTVGWRARHNKFGFYFLAIE